MNLKEQILKEVESYIQESIHELERQLSTSASGERGGLEDDLENAKRQLTVFRYLPRREYGATDVIIPSSLVELEYRGVTSLNLIVPSGGGLVLRVENRPVQVMTPQSPLGEALIGKKQGETVKLKMQNGTREYKITKVC